MDLKALVFIKNRAALLLTVVAILIAGCTPEEEPINGGNNSNDSIEDCAYVDLGLPSGTLWAVCNVGADSPEDCGDYFAWGETVTKEFYDWKSYSYSAYGDGYYVLTKYCTDSYWGLNGFVDSLTVLEQVDDAVRANWGDDWRMPTKEDYGELFQNTTYVWTTQNGVEGRLLTGSNGNSIFMPATGFRMDGELLCPGLGLYWSSSLQTGSQMSAWSFHFDYEECHVCGTYERSRGQCVRAVRVLK